MNRRSFLQTTGSMAIGVVIPGRAASLAASRIVDTHTHFYDPMRPEGVPWPPRKSPLFRPVYPRDWRAVAEPLGVRQTVVVEASERVEDNAWILALAREEKAIVGVVGNLDPMAPDFADHLEHFAVNPVFRGIRRSGKALYEKIGAPEFRAGMKALAERGLQLDVNGRAPGGADAVARLAAEIGALRVVVDHAGGPGDPQQLTEEWKRGMAALAKPENVFCKISGLIEQTAESSTRYGTAPRETSYYAPILDHCLECFGEDRVLYGSNWPVCEKGGTYADQFRIVNEYFSGRSAEVREKFFWRNSRAAYRWIEG